MLFNNILCKIPFALIMSRLYLGLLILVSLVIDIELSKHVMLFIISYALISDIFDGIIARHLKVSTEKLRRWDSQVDTFFWLAVLIHAFVSHFDLMKPYLIWVVILILL